MARPVAALSKARNDAIHRILLTREDVFNESTHVYNLPKILEYLNADGFDMSERRLHDVLSTKAWEDTPKAKADVSVDVNELLKNFKRAINILNAIVKDKKADQKEKLEAMKQLRPMQMDLMKLYDKIQLGEVEKAAMSRPILVVRFGDISTISPEEIESKGVLEKEKIIDEEDAPSYSEKLVSKIENGDSVEEDDDDDAA